MTIKQQNIKADQRRWKRYEVEVAVKVTLSESGQAFPFNATGTNISEGGMRIVISREIELGRIVLLEVCLPYCQETLKLRAIIRSRNSFNYGIEFINASKYVQQVIVQHCRVFALLQ